MTEWFSISIALIATSISLLSFLSNNKREKEKYTPVFIVQKVTKFDRSYTVQLKNIMDNYVVIKRVYSTNEKLQAEYQGVMDVEITTTIKGEEIKERFRGDTIRIVALSKDDFEAQIVVEGISFSGKKFKVCTPLLNFSNGRKKTFIENRFLEFI